MSIFLTGSSGFVGKNIVSYFGKLLSINKYKRGSVINIQEDFVIHLAGKAHDLKNTSNIQEYYVVNTELTKTVFNSFLKSDAKVFITLSSVKAVADQVENILSEEVIPNPFTHYGKSKLLAKNTLFLNKFLKGKDFIYYEHV